MAPYSKYDSSYIMSKTLEDITLINNQKILQPEFSEFVDYIKIEDGEPVLWIYGYGSLIWLPKFEYSKSEVGFVEGFAIRFWQGNTTHRGTPDAPGRVATLIEDRCSVTWGRSFQLRGMKQINEALKHLCTREMKLGGYKYECMNFHVHDSDKKETLQAITFVATPDNKHYLGPASINEIAATIVYSQGKSGPNLEYLFRLTDSLREINPQIVDEHLWDIENECHNLLKRRRSNDTSEFQAGQIDGQLMHKDAAADSTNRSFVSSLNFNNSFCNIRPE
ncbi:glutathione-specific gamma-glutamylcyclotransferase 1-like [Styela clava]|uniref:glutathione-specific gamma-glutamylcyclotransferase 1-like n=1 Tax=Styela clava TaxID=7725 RepID=UPI0019397308|nr:glutathione-specific gamma-glutamylcyclotransferase 1-like [Styela clava]